ncbi:alpha/beta fold hydrolase [Jatrophihabitans sp. DSM 45814]
METAGTVQKRTFDVGGLQLAADVYAAESPHGVALMLHGGGQTRHSWGAAARRLAAAGWTAITLDSRGHGDSGWAEDGDYTQDAMIGDLEGVLATLDEPPVLVGASMGGLTSLLGVGEGRLRARALVLVDIAPRIEPEGAGRIIDFMRAAPDGFATLEEVADAIGAYNPHRKRPNSLEGLKKNVRQGTDGRWRWHWDPAFLTNGDEPQRGVNQPRLQQAAAAVRIPTLLVRGKQSDVVSVEGAEELVRLIPGSRYVDVSGAGHMVAGDDNDIFSREVLLLLSELDDVHDKEVHPKDVDQQR